MTLKTVTFVFGATLVTSPLLAQNLLANADFAGSIAGWTKPVLPSHQIDWSPVDENGDPASGSLRITNLTAHHSATVYVSECFSVEPGERLSFGASIRATGGSAGNTRAEVWMFQGAGCSGSSDRHYADQRYFMPRSTWGSSHGTAEVPEGVGSAWFFVATTPGATAPAEILIDNPYLYRGAVCVPNSTTMCLSKDRFRATTEWRTPDGTRGWGRVQKLTGESGYFWFFDPANIEVVTKVLDACGFNDRFWVFAAGLTNVQVTTTVYDVLTNEMWASDNALGAAFAPIQDTEAFATCDP